MPLTHDQLATAQHSLRQVRARLAPDDTRFYDRLFSHHPEMREMFRDDIVGQGMKFMATLDTILDALLTPSVYKGEIAELGRAHGDMGVEPQHYAPLGDALFDTFHDILGPDYTKEVDTAWRAAFAIIAARMMEPDGPPRAPE